MIESPNFPLPYPLDLECLYFFTAEPGFIIKVRGHRMVQFASDFSDAVFGSLIKIEFLAFHLEEDGTDCDYDYVIFYDGDSKNSDILAGPFCGPILSFIPEIYSSTEYLTMEFVSDVSRAEGGFQLTYEQMDGTPCGESIIKPTGK